MSAVAFGSQSNARRATVPVPVRSTSRHGSRLLHGDHFSAEELQSHDQTSTAPASSARSLTVTCSASGITVDVGIVADVGDAFNEPVD